MMTPVIVEVAPMLQEITLDFSDETIGNVELTRSRRISGTREAAEAYVPRFAEDVRVNEANFFPPPVYPELEVGSEVFE